MTAPADYILKKITWGNNIWYVGQFQVDNGQVKIFLAPAVTVGETEGAMDSASVFFASSFAYNFVRKLARITIFGMWVTSRWIMDTLKYF